MLKPAILLSRLSPLAGWSFVCLLLGLPLELAAQNGVTIDHRPVACLSTDDFVAVTAAIQSDADLRTAKVYFRADAHPDFYFVEMAPVGESYQAYLPLPDEETHRVVYYIEAVDDTFASNRTVEHDPKVTSTGDCRKDDPLAAWFGGDTPNIIVGAVRSGLTALPPGFQAAGIAGFVSAGSAGGGIGVGVAVGAAAGAGATVGVLASQNKEPETTTSTVYSSLQPTTSIPTTTTVSPTPTTSTVRSTTTTVPGTSTIVPPSPSTTTILSSTTTVLSTTTTSVLTTTTISPTTTTSSPTTTTSVIGLTACFTVQDGDGAAGCRVDFDASCSTGDIVSYSWRFQDDPPFEQTITLPTTNYDWSDNPECGTPFAKLVRLTVTTQGGFTAITQANINPTNPTGLSPFEQTVRSLDTSFTSLLEPPISSGRIEARLITNGNRVDAMDNRTPYRHQLNGRPGTNTIEAAITAAPQSPVAWHFDFSTSDHLVPGSLRVERGSVLVQSSTSVVFRLTGTPGESVRLSFDLQ